MAKQANTAKAAATTPIELVPEMKYIVSIKPGSAAEGALRFEAPLDKLRAGVSLNDLIEHGLSDVNRSRKADQIAQTIRGERKGEYGITVNGNARLGTDQAAQYFARQEVQGKGYMGLDLIVASKQVGGAGYNLY